MNTEKIYRDTKSNHKRVDWDMKNISKPCAEGCSACCHQSVAVLPPEGLVLERFIQDRLTPSQKAHSKELAESWLRVFNQITRDASIENPLIEEEFRLAEKHMTALRVPCPFLEDGSCIVYEARPLVCRTYIVEDDPHECAKNPFRGRSDLSRKVCHKHFPEYIRLNKKMVWMRPLVYAVSELLEVTIPLKPIRMSAGEIMNKI